jgi:hypothetical protein
MKTTTIKTAALCIAVATCLHMNAQTPKVKEFGLGFSGLNNFSLQYRWGNEKKLYRFSGDLGGSGNFGKSSRDVAGLGYSNVINNQTTNGKNKNPLNVSCGLNFSILKLNSLSEKFGLVYGMMFGINYTNSKGESSENGMVTSNNTGALLTYPVISTSKTNSQSFSPRLGVALGVYYKISPSFLVYAEIDPNIYYAYTTTKNSTYQKQTVQQETLTYKSNETLKNNSFGVSGLSNSHANITLVYRINAKKA